MRSTDIDRRIEEVASRQHSAFTRRQALALGAGERFVHRRLATGDWSRPVPGVYVLGRAPGSWLRQAKVAELSVPDSALAVRAAAALHALSDFRRGPIELAAPVHRSSRHTLATVHRFAGIQTTEVDGIRTTTLAQTLFDLAGFVSPLKVERAMDDAIVSGRLLLPDLEERASFYAGSRRRGLPTIRALLDERRAGGWEPPESELEAVLHGVLARLRGAPRVVRQAAFPWRSAQPGRVDTLLPEHRLIVEADGRRWHTRVADFDRDRWRDNEAVANGYRVQRYTWLHLHDFADETVALIERAITVAAAA